MAQVRHDARIEAGAERLLEYLTRHWGAVPRVAREWPQWDRDEQEVFQLEWAVKEARLAQLQEHAAQGELTASQQARYQTLLALIEAQRPVLNRLFAS